MDSIQGKLIPSMCEIQANRQESLIQSKLYREGLVPVCRVMPGKAEWSRIPLKCFNTGENDKNIKFSFRYTFPEGAERVYFAYTFPWSLNDNNKFLDKLIAKNAHREDIYIKREVATLSFEGRPMDMLTITGSNGKLEEREELIPGLFPNSDPSKRPLKFAQKKYIWVSSRVHPGEIAASHMLNGFLGMLLSDPSRDVRVKLALHHFVFVIVPMLNPDGVYRGHYRTDTHGNNLNRCYLNPDPKTMPTIYAADKIIESLVNQKKLFMYLDFHAHANINNVFMFGNTFDFQVGILLNQRQVTSCLFPFLYSVNSPLFDYSKCILNDKGSKGADPENKEGAGRVAMLAKYNITHAYTIEAGYNICTALARQLQPEAALPGNIDQYFECPSESDLPKPLPSPLAPALRTNAFDMAPTTYFFTQKDYEMVGRELIPTLLDLIDRNPVSRITYSPCKNLRTLKLHLAAKIADELPYRNDGYLRLVLADMTTLGDSLFTKYVESGFKDQAFWELRKDQLPEIENSKANITKTAKKKVVKKQEIDPVPVLVQKKPPPVIRTESGMSKQSRGSLRKHSVPIAKRNYEGSTPSSKISKKTLSHSQSIKKLPK